MFYVVSYDIPDDKKRLRMAKTMLDFGDRVQHSVFECRLEDKRLELLIKRLEKFVGTEDSVRIYSLCAKCESAAKTMGRQDEPKNDKLFIV